jgi:hypothetical protein
LGVMVYLRNTNILIALGKERPSIAAQVDTAA